MADKQLFTAASNGFSATSDAFVMREDADHPDLYVKELLFLSIIGGQAAVKAIASGILKKNTELVSLSANRYDDVEDGKRLYAAMRKPISGSWKSRTMRLPETRAWHSIIYSTVLEFNRDESNFVILGEFGEETAQARYLQFLNRRIGLPIHPDWQDWLWQRGFRTGEIRPLIASGVLAWECAPDEGALRLALSRGIIDGSLIVQEQEQIYA